MQSKGMLYGSMDQKKVVGQTDIVAYRGGVCYQKGSVTSNKALHFSRINTDLAL